MKIAQQRGVETIMNPAPAIPLPEEAYQDLGHLIVNETEAAILSGIQNPTNWNEVAAIFIARGVKNVIITLGSEVSSSKPSILHQALNCSRVFSTRRQNSKRLLEMATLYQRGKSK